MVQIQTAGGLCDGRGLRRRCDDEARSVASVGTLMYAGRVHTETALGHEFEAGVAERFYVHTLAVSDEQSCGSVAPLG